MRGYLLAYLFLCFSIGLACLGAVLLATRNKGRLERSFLAYYVALSVLVISALFRTYVEGLEPVRLSTLFVVEYLESIIGLYGVMLTLPLFVHRVFAVEEPWRDRLVVALVLGAMGIQHLTEFVLGGIWDDRGDTLEDLLFAAETGYVLWIGFSRLDADGVYRPLGLRFLALTAISLPGIAFDLFLNDHTAWRFYPVLYCVASVVFTWTLVNRPASEASSSIPEAWGLSERETEVVQLVQDGLSNKEIADRLHISPNTVKTHLRAIFDKGGLRSRFELISRIRGNQSNHPIG